MTSSRTDPEPRKKRYQVYSLTETGNALPVESFDLREQAQRRIDRLEAAYGEMVRIHGARRPRLSLVDALEDTMELMS